MENGIKVSSLYMKLVCISKSITTDLVNWAWNPKVIWIITSFTYTSKSLGLPEWREGNMGRCPQFPCITEWSQIFKWDRPNSTSFCGRVINVVGVK